MRCFGWKTWWQFGLCEQSMKSYYFIVVCFEFDTQRVSKLAGGDERKPTRRLFRCAETQLEGPPARPYACQAQLEPA